MCSDMRWNLQSDMRADQVLDFVILQSTPWHFTFHQLPSDDRKSVHIRSLVLFRVRDDSWFQTIEGFRWGVSVRNTHRSRQTLSRYFRCFSHTDKTEIGNDQVEWLVWTQVDKDVSYDRMLKTAYPRKMVKSVPDFKSRWIIPSWCISAIPSAIQ